MNSHLFKTLYSDWLKIMFSNWIYFKSESNFGIYNWEFCIFTARKKLYSNLHPQIDGTTYILKIISRLKTYFFGWTLSKQYATHVFGFLLYKSEIKPYALTSGEMIVY